MSIKEKILNKLRFHSKEGTVQNTEDLASLLKEVINTNDSLSNTTCNNEYLFVKLYGKKVDPRIFKFIFYGSGELNISSTKIEQIQAKPIDDNINQAFSLKNGPEKLSLNIEVSRVEIEINEEKERITSFSAVIVAGSSMTSFAIKGAYRKNSPSGCQISVNNKVNIELTKEPGKNEPWRLIEDVELPQSINFPLDALIKKLSTDNLINDAQKESFLTHFKPIIKAISTNTK